MARGGDCVKKILLLLLVSGLLVVSGCSSTNDTELTAEEIVEQLKESGLPIENEIIYTEETDPNDLLGRPNQYSSKVNFADDRIEQYDAETDPVGGTVEVFESNKDAKERHDYIESVSEGVAFLQEYMYLNGKVLLRVSYDLTPEQAEEYNTKLTVIID